MKTLLKKVLYFCTGSLIMMSCSAPVEQGITMDKDVLMDKIKGGWAAQTIGVTYGGPTEFRYRERYIPDSIDIPWPGTGYHKDWYENRPGLYDDIYMDLTFVDVFDKYGIDVHVDSHANAYAYADYQLWHANQAARYNIMNGIMPPESGHWRNSPHADDIDFQIEADFAGLMAPGMPNAATEISDEIGHIMNYGDGWYGGVYVAAMYALAFVNDDVDFIVNEALKTIPQESDYYKCQADVIAWCGENEDWRTTWQLLEDKWGDDLSCPNGIKNPFNIEALMNSAYIVMGLLYGDGDFAKTLDISTRCGQDSDCNPASAGGILGTMMGYSNIPDYWLNDLKEVEDMNFMYTDISLNKTYDMGFRQALKVIEKYGGEVKDNSVTIPIQSPEPVRFEQSFEGVIFKEVISQEAQLKGKDFEIEIDGSGIVIMGGITISRGETSSYVAEVEVYVNNELKETVKLPADYLARKLDIFWDYELGQAENIIRLKWINPVEDREINVQNVIVFTEDPA
jgi:hypothetical protein